MLPWILGWSWQRHTGTVRPIAAILFVAAMTMILTGLPFDVLVQVLRFNPNSVVVDVILNKFGLLINSTLN